MRGEHRESGELFSYVSLESRIPKHHPLRKIRKLIDKALQGLDDLFDDLYATEGRPSIPPERLMDEIVRQARRKGLTSNEHFSVGGTLIAATGTAERNSASRLRGLERVRQGFLMVMAGYNLVRLERLAI